MEWAPFYEHWHVNISATSMQRAHLRSRGCMIYSDKFAKAKIVSIWIVSYEKA